MEKSDEKSRWTKPEIYILDFKKTSSGPLTGPTEDIEYSGTELGS